jgi:hypothetical protein
MNRSVINGEIEYHLRMQDRERARPRKTSDMLPPSMDYEVGKGRQYEVEQKAAKRTRLEEALAGRPRQNAGFLGRMVALLTKGRQLRRSQSLAGRNREEVEQYRGRFAG